MAPGMRAQPSTNRIARATLSSVSHQHRAREPSPWQTRNPTNKKKSAVKVSPRRADREKFERISQGRKVFFPAHERSLRDERERVPSCLSCLPRAKLLPATRLLFVAPFRAPLGRQLKKPHFHRSLSAPKTNTSSAAGFHGALGRFDRQSSHSSLSTVALVTSRNTRIPRASSTRAHH